MKENAYQMEFSDLLDKLQTSENWISVTEAKIRNKLYGQNVILSKDSFKNIFISIYISSCNNINNCCYYLIFYLRKIWFYYNLLSNIFKCFTLIFSRI